jgi:predicted FMN-binding regulatory protein PaiB
MTLQEIQKELAKKIEEAKGQEFNKNYTDAQTKNKQKILDDLVAQVKETEEKLKSLNSDFKSKNASLLRELAVEADRVKTERIEIERLKGEAQKELNFAKEDRSNLAQKLKEADSIRQEYISKLDKMKELAKTL